LTSLSAPATVAPTPVAPTPAVSPMAKMILDFFEKAMKSANGKVFEADAIKFATANAATMADLETHMASLKSNAWV
jgi:hypothetical protein